MPNSSATDISDTLSDYPHLFAVRANKLLTKQPFYTTIFL